MYFALIRKNVSRQISREIMNSPRDDHVLARPRPNFDLKFFYGFIQKYIYTYMVGVYVTLYPYVHLWIRISVTSINRLDKFNWYMCVCMCRSFLSLNSIVILVTQSKIKFGRLKSNRCKRFLDSCNIFDDGRRFYILPLAVEIFHVEIMTIFSLILIR